MLYSYAYGYTVIYAILRLEVTKSSCPNLLPPPDPRPLRNSNFSLLDLPGMFLILLSLDCQSTCNSQKGLPMAHDFCPHLCGSHTLGPCTMTWRPVFSIATASTDHKNSALAVPSLWNALSSAVHLSRSHFLQVCVHIFPTEAYPKHPT